MHNMHDMRNMQIVWKLVYIYIGKHNNMNNTIVHNVPNDVNNMQNHMHNM